ncbi:Hsp20/alpha crystallin family protein [Tateyamaria armeniaca]|uniref:Hsp20/alpha crystallin family protein n=1 Tax=Tateyamaria armeniaca TaxID=2518930 RepID=A0ABW8UVC6_9RHOB
MSRPSLPQSREDAMSHAFFPSFQKEMNRLLDQFRSGFPMLDDDARQASSETAFPAIDVVETDDGFGISAEVPGVKEEDLEVSVSGQTLILKGEKSAEHESEQDSFHLVERRYGSFRRQIPLGFTPEEGTVDAEFADGILKLHIAKPAAAKAAVQKIDIKKT